MNKGHYGQSRCLQCFLEHMFREKCHAARKTLATDGSCGPIVSVFSSSKNHSSSNTSPGTMSDANDGSVINPTDQEEEDPVSGSLSSPCKSTPDGFDGPGGILCPVAASASPQKQETEEPSSKESPDDDETLPSPNNNSRFSSRAALIAFVCICLPLAVLLASVTVHRIMRRGSRGSHGADDEKSVRTAADSNTEISTSWNKYRLTRLVDEGVNACS
jgi:hypothetical protein